MIYADNAATTQLDPHAFEAMTPFLLDQYANVSQPYSWASKCRQALNEARKVIAQCIGAQPEEIFFTSGGTESDNWAIKKIGSHGGLIRLITSDIEHHAVLNSCQALACQGGAELTLLPVSSTGVVSPEVLRQAFAHGAYPVISSETTLVSVMLANNEIGTIEPIQELAKIADENGAFFHCDAVQALGHIPLDVKDLGVNLLSASAHKFHGPKGIGFLYIKDGTPLEPLLDGGAQERGRRAGTENVAAIVGMAVALKNSCEQIDRNMKHLQHLEESFISVLEQSGLDYIRNGAQDNHLPGLISVSFKNASGEMLLHRLDLKGICIATGSACDSQNDQISHVIKAIGVPEAYARGTVRISFGDHNTIEDAGLVAREIVKILH